MQDSGAGIPSESIDRIFDPFFTTKLGRGGSGLGLHIIYSIVSTVLGGEIHVASIVGVGSTFTLKLPRQAPLAQA
nr:ATP-binding protein [uncultured Deefgea sp.]